MAEATTITQSPPHQPTVAELQVEITLLTAQRDALMRALNALKLSMDERMLLTQTALNEAATRAEAERARLAPGGA